jgi:hypothetical protein
MFFILTLLSSLSAAIFVNVNINLASAKKSSHTSVGDSNDTGNGDIVSSKGSNGDGGNDRTTTTPSTDQGTIGLSSTTSSASTTTTPTSQQPQPDSSNCNTKFMIGCVTGSSVQCIVAPCGPSPTTSTNASPLTPQQQYQQCAMGIGGGILGNCKHPSSSTTSEQNFAPQTLTPQKCQLLPTDANGNCQRINMQDGISGLPPLPQLGSQEKQAHYDLPYEVTHVKQLPDGSCPVDYHYSTNSSSDRYCLINVSLKNLDGICPVGLIMTTNNECVKMPVLPGTSTGSTGGGFIQLFPIPPATSPPATSPNNTSPYLPPPSTK